jgi:hypothetical protein
MLRLGEERVIPQSLVAAARIAAARRHYTCLRDASEHYRPLGRPARYQAKNTKGLEPHPRTAWCYRPQVALLSGD